MNEGFIDLRRNAVAEGGEGSFWPSFTDIMMVVVMIFMIASTVLLLRNWDLVRELRATLESERRAEELARSATETSATLEEQLAMIRREAADLRARLQQAEELNRKSTRQLNQQAQRLLAMEADKQQLAADLAQSRRALRQSSDELEESRTQAAQLAEARDQLESRLQQALEEQDRLEEETVEQAAALAEVQRKRTLSEQQLVSLQGEYDEIRIKYDKLVKPARSPSGKHVVSVRYWKEDEYYQIRLRDAGEDQFQAVSRKELYARLQSLKDKYTDDLYVKVIIPDDSGLSYSEAWGFTFDILQKYDYYHQNEP
jgi:chromosome segregation ATPase